MVTRQDLALALSYGTTGIPIARFRDEDITLPVIARAPLVERTDLQRISDRTIWSQGLGAFVPVRQVLDGFTLTTEEDHSLSSRSGADPHAGSNPPLGTNFTAEFAKVQPPG